MAFIHPEFLLSCGRARHYYHTFAEAEPILDYHCHLPPQDIAENRQFANLFEIWLEGDHYKWRAMRANGTPERFCTGDAGPYEKFLAWARTSPHTLRNPLFHWTQLELKRYFDIDELLDESSAERIWRQANERLAGAEMRVWGIFKRFQVKALCTTDDPTDDLAHHKTIAQSGLETKVFPTFRPDKALAVHHPKAFIAWIAKLAAAANVEIRAYPDFIAALKKRHDYFHSMGCRLSDHGLTSCFAGFISENETAAIFDRAVHRMPATPEEQRQFAASVMLHFGRWDAARGWTKQLHLGAQRNNSTRLFGKLGPDTGFDSMGDYAQMEPLGAYLDRLDQEDALPKTIIYNVNPVQNYAFATMIGNFQDGTIPGKVQFGSGWWFLDQKEGMEWQMNALSNVGLLSRFIGMLTDSRSFMSYPRHEYFRRTLCNLIGRDVESGDLPDREDWIGEMIRNICYTNASRYLGLGV